MTVYDILAGHNNLARSRPLKARRLRQEFPSLEPAGLDGGATYFDAQMDDSRLCLEVLKTAAGREALVANYVEAVAFEKCEGLIRSVRVVDRIGGGEWSIRARQVLNAGGPWVDEICGLAGDPTGPRLRPTKGVHVVVPDLGLRAAFLLLHPADGRVYFVIPWMNKTLIGTTDTLCDGSPDSLTVADDEIRYLLDGYNHYFRPHLTGQSVLGSFAGLRPLIREVSGDPAAMSREFRVFTSSCGLVSIAGGKFTTYRRMAEVVADTLSARLGRRRRGRTKQQRLDGTPPLPMEEFERQEVSRLHSAFALEETAARHLVGRYGRRACDVAAYLTRAPQLARPVLDGEPDLLVEFVYQRDHEMAARPEDYLLRRTRLGLFHRTLQDGDGIVKSLSDALQAQGQCGTSDLQCRRVQERLMDIDA